MLKIAIIGPAASATSTPRPSQPTRVPPSPWSPTPSAMPRRSWPKSTVCATRPTVTPSSPTTASTPSSLARPAPLGTSARQPGARRSSRLRDTHGLHDDGGERRRTRDLHVLPGLTILSERVPGHHSLVLLHGQRHQGTLHDRHRPAASRASAPRRPVGTRGTRVRVGGAPPGRPHPAARLRTPRYRDNNRGDGAAAPVDQVAAASSRPLTVDVSVSERTRTTRLMPVLFNR